MPSMELHEHELYYIQDGSDATKYSVLHYSYYLTKHPFFLKKKCDEIYTHKPIYIYNDGRSLICLRSCEIKSKIFMIEY